MGVQIIPTSPFAVVSPDGTGNSVINQLIGNRNDGLGASTMFAYQHDNWEALHHEQEVYPTLADAILVTAHADAWKLGDYVEIAPVDAITHEFHIHHLHIHAPSADGEYELVLYAGTTVIGKVTFTRTDKKDDIEGLEIRTIVCEAGAQIQAKLASGNAASADSLMLKFWYHHHDVGE